MRFQRGTGKSGGEEGFTIVEVVISIAVLAMVSAPLAGAFWAAIRTAGVAGHRTDGSSIASREIEGMRAVPYPQVGFYADETGYASSFEGFTTERRDSMMQKDLDETLTVGGRPFVFSLCRKTQEMGQVPVDHWWIAW